MAASAAFAGLAGCTKLPTQKIVPYVRQPEEIIPGKPLFYATAVTLGGVATGVLVESHMARPTKVEGNPDHPGSLGASDAFAQASILGLYDPDRSQAEIHDGRIGSWAAFQDELSTALGAEKGTSGAGLRLLTSTITSPSLAEQIRTFLKGVSVRQMACSMNLLDATMSAKARSRLRRICKSSLPCGSRRSCPHARFGLPHQRARKCPLRARVFAEAARRECRIKDESAVLGGIALPRTPARWPIIG